MTDEPTCPECGAKLEDTAGAFFRDLTLKLESQNQALQERAEKAEAEREEFYERTKRLMDEMLPLQERIEELTAALNEAIGHLTSNEWKHDASSRRRTKAVKEATRALAPTQETDPE